MAARTGGRAEKGLRTVAKAALIGTGAGKSLLDGIAADLGVPVIACPPGSGLPSASGGHGCEDPSTPPPSFDSLLRDPAVTAVLLAAPGADWTRWCAAALEAGKNVLVLEPPVSDGRDIVSDGFSTDSSRPFPAHRLVLLQALEKEAVGRIVRHPPASGRGPAVLALVCRQPAAQPPRGGDANRFPNALIHPTAEIDDEVVIGDRTRIWHFSHILRGTRIGADCSFGQNCCIGANVTIGNGCRIQNNVSIYDGATLEDDVFCGPSCVFTNVLTPRAFISRKHEFLPTLVRRGASIGANATVVCGTTLGRYCLIGAGAVVIRDVPDHALMVGNPARRIGWVSETGDRLGTDLVCPRTGERYEETPDGQLRKIAAPNG